MKKLINFVPAVIGLTIVMLASFAAFAQDDASLSASETDSSVLSAELTALTAEESQSAVSAEEAAIVPFACATSNCAYLPSLGRAPEVSLGAVVHKTSCAAEETLTEIANGGVVNLGSGQRFIQFGLLAEGYAGKSFRTYYIINGQEFQSFATSGTITSNRSSVISTPLIFGTGTTCQSPLPAGTYTVRFIIDGQVVTDLTAVLQ